MREAGICAWRKHTRGSHSGIGSLRLQLASSTAWESHLSCLRLLVALSVSQEVLGLK